MGEVTDILEFWGLFSTWVSIHFVRFYVTFYACGQGRPGGPAARQAGPEKRKRNANKKNNLLYSSRDYGILALYILAKVY